MKTNHKRIAEITLGILNNKLWKNISLSEIKSRTKISSFDKFINNKKDLLIIINNYFDYKLISKIKNVEESNKKDMIFEILMMRFDILQIHRKGIISICDSFKKEPKELIFLLPNLLDSVIMMINYAKISSNGIIGQMKIKGIFIIYVLSFFTWMKDETNSLEKTMIVLDKYLDQAATVIKLIK